MGDSGLGRATVNKLQQQQQQQQQQHAHAVRK